MDLGTEDRCQFEEIPGERAWVTTDPETIDVPEEEQLDCPRHPLEDAEYCAFHLSPSEQKKRGIDTGTRLRERLEALADGEEPADKDTDFRGAFLTGADLSELNFGENAGFTIDLRYADIEADIDFSDLSYTEKINCRFVRCNTVYGDRTELSDLDFSGAVLRNHSRTDNKKIDDSRAFSLGRSGNIDNLSLEAAEVTGDVFINDVDISKKLDCEAVTIQGDLHISTDVGTCNLSSAEIDDKLIIDGCEVEELNCSSVAAERAKFHDVTAGTLDSVSPSVEALRLQTVTVTDSASFSREETSSTTLNLLEVQDCHFHGEVEFDRLEPTTAYVNIDEATDCVSFKHFVCHDATFDPQGHPMFKQDVDFTGANLEGAMLRNFQAGGRAIFTNADLTDARLLDAQLEEAVLEGALLSRARLIAADLTNAYLYHASLSDASIDVSTEFGEYVVYDPRSSVTYDSTRGLDTDNETAKPGSSNEPASSDANDFRADGATSEQSTGNSIGEGKTDERVPPAQKAKGAYQSIHNSARQSGDSATAISMYRKRQEMETELREQGHTGGDGWLPTRFQALLRKGYGCVTGYGVSTRRILAWSGLLILASAVLILLLSDGWSGLVYVIGGFVGTTPGLDTTPGVTLIIGIEALLGALLIALYVNALGRRSSM